MLCVAAGLGAVYIRTQGLQELERSVNRRIDIEREREKGGGGI